MTTVILYSVTIIGLIIVFFHNKKKASKAIKSASKMMKNMGSDIIGILLLIGLVLAIIPPEQMEIYIGESSGFLGTVVAAVVGTITLIPAFVAFPLVGSLKNHGASLMTLTAFITTLTMVGFMTFPLEVKQFGRKFAISRNVLSFIGALAIAAVLGVLL